MQIRSSEQPSLFDAAKQPNPGVNNDGWWKIQDLPLRLSEPSLDIGKAAPGDIHNDTFHAVSPLADMPLREVCALCGDEIHPPGFVIPDYEELGAFCNQACGDRRFRIFLEEEPD